MKFEKTYSGATFAELMRRYHIDRMARDEKYTAAVIDAKYPRPTPK